MKHAWIISCGTELTLGHTVDTNAPWLASKLAAIGISTKQIVTVPDVADAITDILQQASQACDVILMTGGLGPTDDDLTRQALADAAGVPLELDQPSLDRLRNFFAERKREMPERNKVQAMIPRSGQALLNDLGTAPGIVIQLRDTPCYALPGVPFEMEAMFSRQVAPRLKAVAEGHVLLSRHLHCFGLGESDIGERISDLMAPGRNPMVGTSADIGLIDVRLSAGAETAAAAKTLLDKSEQEIRTRLGDIIFGRDEQTLSSVVGELLIKTSATVSTAESCTGGLIGKLLTEVPGSSSYYLGGVVAYANQVKHDLLGVPRELLEEHGAVSPQVARQMVEGAGTRCQSDYALSITGIAGPAGGSAEKPVGLVYIGLLSPGGVSVKECRFGSETPRHVIRIRAARTALHLLRRALLSET